ncbi:ABC transporter ATP-binding protein [Ursidibacter maritimus]|uniref:ABC transporter ATP-binding protein n=1 Tax=Ursidibacter maritimus TaxID=1331689 RepID=A0A949T484_9PAST|nr:ABC transporter ATP-binding protein [Ursidibacter maritimus]KAE9542093.1 ABC transporter permease [Ursidibacter maritimus]MBV6523675.1 ABC transporter ATP-binding protein [Ursidibacter maritimus]MBV6525219.1 ABC transporter ATP-binding protein [Ursidibacter maritimus]MBV6527545.1 ABC transporter ATP-binding protein [Ursidibacter maritimus]MBV6530228.1 ABC transporter ATP-binding protein [Ursidibacter maritimus]
MAISQHSDICSPVAKQLRLATGLAILSQGLKLIIWVLMVKIVLLAEQTKEFPLIQIILLLVISISYYTCKIKAHDQSHYAAFELEKILRQRLVSKISQLPLGKIRQIGSGAMAKVICDDVHELHSFVADAPPLRAEAYSTPLFVFLALFLIDWQLAFATLIFTVSIFVLMKWLLRHSKLSRNEYAKAVANINSSLIEYVQGMSTIRTFDAGEGSYSRFNTALNEFNKVMLAWLKRVGLATRLARSLFSPLPMMLFLVVAGVILQKYHSIASETLFFFLVLAAGLIETMLPYMSLFHLLEKSRAAIERIYQIEAEHNIVTQQPYQFPTDYSISFQQVDFGYDKQQKLALNEVSFTVPTNTFTAIVGESGSGKSTIINLLLRFWDTTSGQILLGNCNIRHIPTENLMSLCSVVFQDNFLFSCTIAENISYGLNDVSQEQIENAAKKAQIHDFIMSLPEKYNTKVGERGQLLSGGQKQRLTIARAFLQDRPILLLDEPTSFSDAKNEASLVEIFQTLMKNKTVIMIAHRLSSIVKADQIIYLSQGKIIAKGNHNDLLKESPAYQQLWMDYQQAHQWKMR